MAGPSPWYVYNLAKNAFGDKVANLGTDGFKVALFTSSSNANTATLSHSGGTPPLYSDLTNEVANGNGYTTGGIAVTPTWSDASGTETFTSTSPTWTASGAGFSAEIAVCWDTTSNNVICWCYLDSTPATVTVPAGNQLAINIAGTGLFSMA